MRVTVQEIGKGLHPSEVVVEVKTSTGTERLVVDKRSVRENSVAVGSPISQRNDSLLVELPRETMTGVWRVWVKRAALKPDKAVA